MNISNKNTFIDEFYLIFKNKEIRNTIDFILNEGEKDSRFINYFGVNYKEKNIVSIKLYFSFFDFLPKKTLSLLNFDTNSLSYIKRFWTPIDTYRFFHQGLTIALKCYLVNGKIEVQPYFHFRSEKLPYTSPKYINLTEKDKQNPFGVCIQKHKNETETKHYYYLTDSLSIKKILKQFSLKNDFLSKLNMVEYTESSLERKINLIFKTSEDTRYYLHRIDNPSINSLNNHFFNTMRLYHFAPGIRHNSDIHAIYYIPKDAHYYLCKIDTIKSLLNSHPI